MFQSFFLSFFLSSFLSFFFTSSFLCFFLSLLCSFVTVYLSIYLSIIISLFITYLIISVSSFFPSSSLSGTLILFFSFKLYFFCLGLFSHNNRYVSQIRENNHFTNFTVAYTDNQNVDTKLAKKRLYVRTPLAFPFSIPFFSSCDKSKWGSGWMGGVEEKEKKK